MRICLLLFAGLSLGSAGCGGAPEDGQAYDIVFLHGTILDGNGGEPFVGDLAVRDGRIVEIGDLSAAASVESIDIQGLVLAPGFIDVHSHAEEGLLDPELRTNKGFVTQGVTTCIFGVDGAHSLDTIRNGTRVFEEQGVGTNYAFYIGHNGVRAQVMGNDDRPPDDAELEAMKAIVRDAMEEGSLGLSTGLMYLPGNFATTEEVVELARITADYGGRYDSHIRDPANNLLASLEEAIEIGEEAGAVPHPAHVKAVGGNNFGRAAEIVALVESAIARGIDVTVDQYPYDGAAANKLVALPVPPPDLDVAALLERMRSPELGGEQRAALGEEITRSWQRHLQDPDTRDRIRRATEEPESGVYSWIDTVGYSSFRIVVSEHRERVGRMFVEVAEQEGLAPFDLLAEMIISEGSVAKITLGAIQEEDVRTLMVAPWVMIASDGAITGFENGGGHPRHRGTFPRVLGRYVREWGVLSLEEAIRKMTSLPADYLGLADRGRLEVGNWADLAVFDPDTVIDRSTWAEPSLFSEGLVHVLVNGGFAMRDGEMTGETHGRHLRAR